MKHFYQNIGENWFTYSNLYTEMVYKFGNNSHFVEVGSWRGRSSVYMAVEIINSGYNIKFDCVDTWGGSSEHQNFEIVRTNQLFNEFIKNIEPVKDIINPIRMKSAEASNLYCDNSLDFVFIDAGHSYEEIVSDILKWLPKVKIGGILGGHDYIHEEGQTCCFGVNMAVDELLSKEGLTIRERSWYITKKTENKKKLLI